MPLLTPAKEIDILTALKTKFEAVEDVSNVIIDDDLFDSEQDVIDNLSIQKTSDDETEVKYIYISFASFEDQTEDGCEDDPAVTLNYNAHIFWQYKEKRADNSRIANDFKALVINLRNKFLNKNRTLEGIGNCETAPLVQNHSIILDNDDLTGFYGYIADFTVPVEIGF
ncbi:MAG: hypothetical protein LUM44_09770 [Pyrinomonadaceae bacterium]|nr:hypothetical protein [Pyrinomonadaceae bacterium]